jgi:calcium-dependent protein kinase
MYALKQVNLKNVEKADRISGEVEILRELHHPNIVRLYDSEQNSEELKLILEYADDGDLSMKIKK